jgi:propionate catabolism operon transcriptional regulator
MNRYRFAFVSNSREVSEAIVAHSDPTSELITVHLASMERAVPVARQLLDDGIEVIIGGGGTGNILAESIGQAVVKIDRSPAYLMPALMAARAHSKKIAVTVFSQPIEGLATLSKYLDIELHQVVFSSTDELETGIRKSISEGAEIVVGGGICKQIAERYGAPTVVVIPERENVLQTLYEARAVAASRRAEKRKFEELNTILQTIREGIIVVDSLRRVTVFNAAASDILSSILSRKQAEAAVGKKLPAVLDVFGLSRVIETGQGESDRIHRIGDLNLVITSQPILVDDQLVGVICSIREASRIQNLERKVREDMYRRGFVAKHTFEEMTAASPSLGALAAEGKQYAKSDAAVLIQGETGTGKELLAQSIHNASKRASQPFLAINCSALPETLLESELFGYEEGAFTGARRGGKVGLFEMAHKGTLFLDEIADISPSLQVRLLRAIERNEVMRVGGDRIVSVDVRIISSTQVDLYQAGLKGKFRPDLYFRLSTLILVLPALRERARDIPVLLEKLFAKVGRFDFAIDPDLLNALSDYDWPGNIRELEATVQTYAALHANEPFDASSLKFAFLSRSRRQTDGKHNAQRCDPLINFDEPLKKQLSLLEQQIIRRTLSECANNRSEAARRLGISINSLWRKSRQTHLDS